MQKLLSLKFVSDLPTNVSRNHSFFNSGSFKTFHSLAQKTPRHPTHFFSHFAPAPSWRSQKTTSETISGFLSNHTLPKQLLLNTLLKIPSRRCLTHCSVAFLRAQFPRRNVGFNPSFDSLRNVRRSWLPRATTDGVVFGLILANVAVFMLWRVADHNFMVKNFTISLDNFMSGRVHTLITSAFSHIQLEHIISNMIGLYFFGMSIGRNFGPDFLLKLYLAGAIGGSVFYLAYHAYMTASSKGNHMAFMASRTTGLGASGAVNAVMLLNIFLFPKSTLYLEFIIPVPAFLLGVFLIGKDMLRIMEEIQIEEQIELCDSRVRLSYPVRRVSCKARVVFIFGK
ncbi:RHOMBOID-like protein 12, mitochondrial isoform X2 [Malania oleifera]|uniref:RHOMBOID-like protein 12, mitochondrial isoform X2 n=1 Tax=Malania oleifera TaxID=397392 RepID=UPI0025AE5206|nr:RHOMBOID-like protein 12, mitochondrial isoform X2 [Malania oleifera]